jgi:hypothetical protein
VSNYLILDSDLSQPPHEIISFRELTLLNYKYFEAVLIEIDMADKLDPVFRWLKRYGALDYCNGVIYQGEEHGIKVAASPKVANVTILRLCSSTTYEISSRIRLFSPFSA